MSTDVHRVWRIVTYTRPSSPWTTYRPVRSGQERAGACTACGSIIGDSKVASICGTVKAGSENDAVLTPGLLASRSPNVTTVDRQAPVQVLTLAYVGAADGLLSHHTGVREREHLH